MGAERLGEGTAVELKLVEVRLLHTVVELKLVEVRLLRASRSPGLGIRLGLLAWVRDTARIAVRAMIRVAKVRAGFAQV